MAEAVYDVVIVGGGPAGASLVAALDGQGLRIAVIEAVAFDAGDAAGFDARTVALAYSSKMILSTLGVWESIDRLGATAIERIHISDRTHGGSAHLDCREQGVEALGYVVDMRVLGKALGEKRRAGKNVDYLCPAILQSVDFKTDPAEVHYLQDGERRGVSAKLVVAADGGQSLVRRQSGIKTRQSRYGQTAIIANVVTDKPHNNIAYERFTDSGPMALLPSTHPDHPDSFYALVWTVEDKQGDAILALSDNEFLARLQARFGLRAGHFTASGSRHAYPLGVMLARQQIRPRLAIIGNAAHTLHPVAGQGFNLGLRDVAGLAQVISEAANRQLDIGSIHVLQQYAKWRRRDQWQTMAFTDGLVRLFSSRLPPLVLARNLGLLALDIMPPVKKAITRHAMGYVGKLSRLARGITL